MSSIDVFQCLLETNTKTLKIYRKLYRLCQHYKATNEIKMEELKTVFTSNSLEDIEAGVIMMMEDHPEDEDVLDHMLVEALETED